MRARQVAALRRRGAAAAGDAAPLAGGCRRLRADGGLTQVRRSSSRRGAGVVQRSGGVEPARGYPCRQRRLVFDAGTVADGCVTASFGVACNADVIGIDGFAHTCNSGVAAAHRR